MVGQVSGSLFQNQPAASTSSLSALFSTVAPAEPVRFQPPPKPVVRSPELKEKEKSNQDKKSSKQQKKKSGAQLKLESRELSLQAADEDECGGGGPPPHKKKKKKNTGDEEGAQAGGRLDAEHWVMKRQQLKARKAEDAVKNNRTVFVGNLPATCTKKMLMSVFRDKGPIESIRFRSVVREDPSVSQKVAVIQRKVHPKKQSLNAYVVFKDEEGVEGALERNGMEIQTDYHIRVDRVASSSAHDHKRSIFVGNLSFEINELALRRHFEECGSVEAVRLIRDQSSGMGKGFGYVLFQSADSVQLALKLDGTKLEGRAVRVKRSVRKEKQKNKAESKAVNRRPGKGPQKIPRKGPQKGPQKIPGKGPQKGPGQVRGFRPPKKFSGTQHRSTGSSKSFRGEMVDPSKKAKKKGVKKKVAKPRKAVHI